MVEDDPVIGKELCSLLEKEGMPADWCRDGESGVASGATGSYSLILLDVMLPKVDGWEVCARLRRHRITTPILMLTARDSVDDRVKGLTEGADDYLAKPFDVRELIARMRALLRRDKVHRTGRIEVADLVIDTQAKTVSRAGRPIKLTPREFSLLEALARNEGRTLTREMILEGIWNNEDSLENTVNFHVTSLRKKVDAEFDVKLIHTVHGFGYVLRTE